MNPLFALQLYPKRPYHEPYSDSVGDGSDHNDDDTDGRSIGMARTDIRLILSQAEAIERLTRDVEAPRANNAALRAKLDLPPKTPEMAGSVNAWFGRN